MPIINLTRTFGCHSRPNRRFSKSWRCRWRYLHDQTETSRCGRGSKNFWDWNRRSGPVLRPSPDTRGLSGFSEWTSKLIYIYIHVEYIRYTYAIYVHICLHTYIHTYLPTYLPTYIHTYIHTCIYIYTYDICLHMSIYIICSSGSILAPLGPAWHQTFFTSFYRHIFRFISPLKKILGLADHSGDCCPWWPRWSSNFYDSQAAKCGIVAKIWSFMDHVMYIYKDVHIAGSFCSARSFEWHFWFLSGELFVGSSATWTS